TRTERIVRPTEEAFAADDRGAFRWGFDFHVAGQSPESPPHAESREDVGRGSTNERGAPILRSEIGDAAESGPDEGTKCPPACTAQCRRNAEQIDKQKTRRDLKCTVTIDRPFKRCEEPEEQHVLRNQKQWTERQSSPTSPRRRVQPDAVVRPHERVVRRRPED